MKRRIHKRTYNREIVSEMQNEPMVARVQAMASRMVHVWHGRGEFYLMHLPREWWRALRDVEMIFHCEKDMLWDVLSFWVTYYGDQMCQAEVTMLLLDVVAEFEDRKKKIMEG